MGLIGKKGGGIEQGYVFLPYIIVSNPVIIEDNLIRMRISKIENIFNIPSTPNYIGNFIPNKTIKSRYSISNIKTNLSSTSD